MKLIIAYIKPERLPAVKQALYSREVYNMSVVPAKGCGQQKGFHESYRGQDIEVTLHNKLRIEIAINDAFKDAAVQGILEGAATGELGDGKIFVIPLEECIRICTGETGDIAVGGDKVAP